VNDAINVLVFVVLDFFFNLTPVAGLIFETKNRAIFSGELFSGKEFLE